MGEQKMTQLEKILALTGTVFLAVALQLAPRYFGSAECSALRQWARDKKSS